MRIKVTSVKALEKYKIHASFNDGTEGVYDLSNCAGKGVFKVWEEPGYFDKVFINPENNAIACDDYLEIDTINCYMHVKGITIDEYREMFKENNYAFS